MIFCLIYLIVAIVSFAVFYYHLRGEVNMMTIFVMAGIWPYVWLMVALGIFFDIT